MKVKCVRLTALSALLCAQAVAQEQADLNVVHRIRAEAFQNSKVMDHMFWLTDVAGPRITNTPGYQAAADWVVKRLREYGLENVRQESTGPFGRGWTFSRFSAHLLEPSYAPLIGFPLAWTAGTPGTVVGEPVLAVLQSEADFARHKGKLKGRIVLVESARKLEPVTRPPASRHTDQDLAGLLAPPDPSAPPRRIGPSEAGLSRTKLSQFLIEEGVAVTLSPGYRGEFGTTFASTGGSRSEKDPIPPTGIALAAEHYNRIVRLLEKKVPVKLEIEVQARMTEPADGRNVIGDLPGREKKDELVLMGGHLDSWHGGTGATDNAAGVAVAIEAARILKTLGLNLRRTVRVGFWAGEEVGFVGSRSYVKEHLADRETMALKPEHARVSAYFNYDNGCGKIRGIYLQGNDMLRPVFEAWLKPFHDVGAATVTIRNTYGTDHQAFDEVGVPGFQFIQDPLDYGTVTHHSNMDVLERCPAGDLMQSAAILASFVYHTAVRDELLPRKPLPMPRKTGEPRRP